MQDKQWWEANHPYDFILQRYKDSIQYLNKSLKTSGVLSYLPDKLEDKELEIFCGLLGTETIEGLYILNSLRKTESINGDVCEYGVAQGATSTLIANSIFNQVNKNLYLFDSFSGLPKPSKEDELKDDIFKLGNMESYEGTMACHPNECIYRLERMNLASKRINMVPGFVENTIGNTPQLVSFAFVDFDFYAPIKLTLNTLHSKLTTGGIIIVDDYDFFSTGVKKAVQEFLSDKDCYDICVPEKWMGNFCVLEKKEV
jgi:hypothetical protein